MTYPNRKLSFWRRWKSSWSRLAAPCVGLKPVGSLCLSAPCVGLKPVGSLCLSDKGQAGGAVARRLRPGERCGGIQDYRLSRFPGAVPWTAWGPAGLPIRSRYLSTRLLVLCRLVAQVPSVLLCRLLSYRPGRLGFGRLAWSTWMRVALSDTGQDGCGGSRRKVPAVRIRLSQQGFKTSASVSLRIRINLTAAA